VRHAASAPCLHGLLLDHENRGSTVCSSETSVKFSQTTQRHITYDSTHHSCRENLKSEMMYLCSDVIRKHLPIGKRLKKKCITSMPCCEWDMGISRYRGLSSISKQAASRTTLLAACYMLVSCLAYSSALRMEATYSSGKYVDFHRTTRLYIREDRNLQQRNCDSINVKL
jgi:hypothetical protein